MKKQPTTPFSIASLRPTTPNAVDHPAHYTAHPSGIEAIVICEHMGFCLGNVVKYLFRADEKGTPLDDLRKARWYLDREIKRREADQAGGRR